MTRAVIAIADQIIVQELRSRLDEVDAEIEQAETESGRAEAAWEAERRLLA